MKTNHSLIRFAVGLVGTLVCCPPAYAIDVAARVKAVGTWFNAADNDQVARFGVNPAYGSNLDFRLTLGGELGFNSEQKKTSPWSWELAAELTTLQGDTLENGGLFGGASSGEGINVVSDALRAVNLTTQVSSGSRHAVAARLDRAQLVYQKGSWRARLGRQALSLGSGLVFNPMDIFNPFAPTATDRDFKAGSDALLITRSGNNGSELEAFAVFRRELGERNPHADQGSYALRYRSTVKSLEYEVIGARHFDATVAMASLSGPLKGAVWRVNWVGSHEQGETTHSVVANLDYGFGFREQLGYAFVEYYHNGYGNRRAAENISNLSLEAFERLGRGELFVTERNYLSAGTQLGLTPLLNFTTTAIVNLDDLAPLVQSAFSYTASNNVTIEAGAIVPTGGSGDEFGGVVISPQQTFADELLTGTSRQYYLRLVWFL